MVHLGDRASKPHAERLRHRLSVVPLQGALLATCLFAVLQAAASAPAGPTCSSCCTITSGVLSDCSGCGSFIGGDLSCSSDGDAITSIEPDTFANVQIDGRLDFTSQQINTISQHAFRGANIQGDVDFAACPLSLIETDAFKDASFVGMSFPHVNTTVQPFAFRGATLTGQLSLPNGFNGPVEPQAFASLVMGGFLLADPTFEVLPSFLFEGSTITDSLGIKDHGGSKLAFIGPNALSGLVLGSSAEVSIEGPLLALNASSFANVDASATEFPLRITRSCFEEDFAVEVIVEAAAFNGSRFGAELKLGASSPSGGTCVATWHLQPGAMGGISIPTSLLNVPATSQTASCLSVQPGAFLPTAKIAEWSVDCLNQDQVPAGAFEGLHIGEGRLFSVFSRDCNFGLSVQGLNSPAAKVLEPSFTLKEGAFQGALLNCGVLVGAEIAAHPGGGDSQNEGRRRRMKDDENSAGSELGKDRLTSYRLTIEQGAFQGLLSAVPRFAIIEVTELLLEWGSFAGLSVDNWGFAILGLYTSASQWLVPGAFSGLSVAGQAKIEFGSANEALELSSEVWSGFNVGRLYMLGPVTGSPGVLNFTDFALRDLEVHFHQLDFSPGGSAWKNLSVSGSISLTQYEMPTLPVGSLANITASGMAVRVFSENLGQVNCFPGRAIVEDLNHENVLELRARVLGVFVEYSSQGEGISISACSCPRQEMPVATTFGPVCALCSPGKYCPGDVDRPCPKGSFSDEIGLTDESQCTPCPSGTYGPFLGATSSQCTACPAGTASSEPGASKKSDCAACAPGTFSSGPGQQQCSLCPLGTFTDAPGQAACSPCPLGTYGTRSGGTNETDACAPCPAGQTTFSAGTPSIASCVPGSTPSTVVCPAGQSPTVRGECEACPLGHVCPDGEAVACPVGTFNNALGQSDAEESCTPCPAGTFNSLPGQTSVSCVPCSPGTASGVEGATSGSACEACTAGSFAALAGASVCSPCAQGTYAVRARSVSCEACPVNTYGSGPGGALVSSACLACPEGTDTAGLRGVSGLEGCVETPEEPPAQCGAGEVRDPDNSTQCLEVRCGAGLAPVGGGCVGCPAGTFGVPPSCAQCPRGGLCPGGTVSAVLSPGDLRASAPALAAAAEAGSAVEAGSGASGQEAEDSPGSVAGDLTTISGIAVVSATLGAALLLPLLALLLAKCSSHTKRFLLWLDTFSLDHDYPDRFTIHKASTVLGGACTISLVAVLCGFLASSLLQYYTANTLVTTRFDPAGSAAQEAGIVTSQWRLDVAAVIDGVQSAGDCPGAQSTLDFTGGGADGVRMPWAVASSVTLQRVEAASGASALACQYAASCSECTLATTLRARLRLPYTAQSVAWAMTTTRASTPATPGQPTKSVLQGSVGASSSQRLRSGEWTLTSTREVLVDTQGGSDATGYLLAFVDQQAGFLDSSAPTSGFVPQLTPVSLQLSVQLSPSVSFITVSELQSLLGLLAALGGLAGATFGIFSFAFRFGELPVQSALSHVGLLGSEDLYVPPGEESGSSAGTVKPMKEAPLASTPPPSE